MQEYEITCKSWNKANPKRTIALVVAPDRITPRTGFIHFAHGWGGNRFAFVEMYREFAERYDLIACATEYRGSGYDCDSVLGRGALLPYDAGHLQVFDCLCALRAILAMYPGADTRRVIAWGGSLGGQIALLMASFCPSTLALVISLCGASHLSDALAEGMGRDFSDDELAIRDVARMANRIECPVALIHGVLDTTVPDMHARRVETALQAAGRTVRAKYLEGVGHAFEPGERIVRTQEVADDWLRSCRRNGPSDFEAGTTITISCIHKTLVIDWSKASDDPALIRWESGCGFSKA